MLTIVHITVLNKVLKKKKNVKKKKSPQKPRAPPLESTAATETLKCEVTRTNKVSHPGVKTPLNPAFEPAFTLTEEIKAHFSRFTGQGRTELPAVGGASGVFPLGAGRRLHGDLRRNHRRSGGTVV